MGRSRQRTLDFYTYFLAAYPWRTVSMIALMVVAGLAEGLGVVTLVPVLEFADAGQRPDSKIGGLVVDGIAALGVEPSLAVLLAAIVAAIVVKNLLLFLAQNQVGYTVSEVTRDLRLALIRALLDVRWAYFGDRTIGQFSNAISGEAVRSAAAYREACQVLAALIQIFAYLAVAAALSWQTALITVVIGALLSVLLRRFFRDSREAGRVQTRLSKSLSARLVDVLQGIKPLKAMGKQDLVWPHLEAKTEGLNLAQRKQVLAAQALRAYQEPIVTVLLAFGLYMVLDVGNQPLSSVLVLAFVFYRLMSHISTLQARYQVMVNGESAFFSLRDELERAQAAREVGGGTYVPDHLRNRIQLRKVTFAYDEKPVLDHVDMEIPAGAFVTLMGESGSGKTTLADLITGLYEPLEGEILVDEIPLGELDLSAWRARIGYVPQEMLLFNDTVFGNVTLGEASLEAHDVERALRLAGAWSFIQEKPGGMSSRIGERGGMLSGGQRQRIAIARALVHRPSLLILDEVTTALDPETERGICATLRDLAGEVTILSISHQPAMREVADFVYLMRQGRVERVTASLSETTAIR